MTVTWLGHACFLLESGGYRVVLDPYDVETYPELRVCAHAVLCSHEHRDHCFSSAVTLLRDGKQSPFTVGTVDTFHDEKQGALRGGNKMHILRAEGLTVVHAGDLGHELDDAQLAAVKHCDALLLPIGGYYTVDAPTAKRIVDAVSPRIVVPMHYRFGTHGYDVLGTVEEFTALCPAAEVTMLDSDSFVLTGKTPRGVLVPRFAEETRSKKP